MRTALKWMVIGSLGFGFAASAADTVPTKQARPGLQQLTKVTPDAAQATALKQVPGTVTSSTLKDNDGLLIYSVVISSAGQNATVSVDGSTGQVLSVVKVDPSTHKTTVQEFSKLKARPPSTGK